jgi:hypothetical protein
LDSFTLIETKQEDWQQTEAHQPKEADYCQPYNDDILTEVQVRDEGHQGEQIKE